MRRHRHFAASLYGAYTEAKVEEDLPLREVQVAAHNNYVRTDEHGVMRVGDSRVMLDSVVASFLQGCSPETIQEQYPALSLEAVYGAIAYYLGHRDEVESYLRQQDRTWEVWRAKADVLGGPVVRRLRAVRGATAQETI